LEGEEGADRPIIVLQWQKSQVLGFLDKRQAGFIEGSADSDLKVT
jgi:hypothetical protein